MIKFTILLSCVAAASVATKSCNIFLNDEPVPLSRSSSGDPIREDTESYVTFLTDFSRFMNNKAPALLQEFAESKAIFQANKRPVFRTPATIVDLLGMKVKRQTSGNTTRPLTQIGQTAQNLTNQLVDTVAKPVANMFNVIQDVVSSVSHAIQTGIPPAAWNYICFAAWFPLHEKHCPKARCAMCSPAVMSAAAACKNSGADASQKCINDIMGEGFCNFCAAELLDF